VKYNVEEKEIVQDKDQKEEVEIENEFEEEENRFSREELSDDESKDMDMTSSTYGLASLFDSMYVPREDEDDDRKDIVTIKTTTLVILFCVSIAAGMSVGTGTYSFLRNNKLFWFFSTFDTTLKKISVPRESLH